MKPTLPTDNQSEKPEIDISQLEIVNVAHEYIKSLSNSDSPAEKISIKPTVDPIQEFIEIATDFSNPLDLIREAISNSFDAQAQNIRIAFNVVRDTGEDIMSIEIEDDGTGMDEIGLRSFFDLGNSLRRGDKTTIGEKGHGTKVYFNSAEIEVITSRDGFTYRALMEHPFKTLHQRQLPTVTASRQTTPGKTNGTLIKIKGYNNNRQERFKQHLLKDYIMWFTKFGSCEGQFEIRSFENRKISLKGLDVSDPEIITFGHCFGEESKSLEKLLDEHMVAAPEYYCKKVIKKNGNLKNFPAIKYQAIFCIEGDKIKRQYNPMLRRQGQGKAEYKVQDRYGLWLCKDFVPIQQANNWFGSRGTEYTKFHAFLNCQDLRLTANRSSVNNTPSEILDDLRREVEDIYAQIEASADWRNMEYLEDQADAHNNAEKEKKDFEDRKRKFNKSLIANFKNHVLNAPQHESAVFGLVLQLTMLEPGIFPFEILDYNTHRGYDLLVKGDHTTPIHNSTIFYVELKYVLTDRLNHSFQNLKAIITWDTAIKNEGTVTDLNDEERTMMIVPPEHIGDTTKYFLDQPRKGTKIEVFVLKEYLREKLGIDFRSRNTDEII